MVGLCDFFIHNNSLNIQLWYNLLRNLMGILFREYINKWQLYERFSEYFSELSSLNKIENFDQSVTILVIIFNKESFLQPCSLPGVFFLTKLFLSGKSWKLSYNDK